MRQALLEREQSLDAVVTAVARAQAGRGGTLLIVGAAGTGKSSLLAAAVRAAAARGIVAAHARGAEMETGIALGVLHQLDDVLGGGAADARPAAPAAPSDQRPVDDPAGPVPRAAGRCAAPPGLPGSEPPTPVEPSAPYLRALAALERRRPQPLLLAVDDLHWADDDSLRVLMFLARRLRGLPVALIATLRPWPPAAAEAGEALADAGEAALQRLEPLSPRASRTLLADRIGRAVGDDDDAQAWALCRGNPLLIEQLAAGMRDDARPAADVGAGDRLLLRRFAGLDAATLRYARCASAMGTSFEPEVALAAADIRPDEQERALDALARSGLVAEPDREQRPERGPSAPRFVHALVRQALYDELAPPVRRRVHRRIFEELTRRGRSREAAEHAIHADLADDERAAALLERVGRAALREGAVAAAARTLGAAVRFRGDRADATVLLVLAEALCAAGRVHDAAAVCERALALPALAWETRVDALVLLGRCRYMTSEPGFGEPVLAEAAALAAEHDPVKAVPALLDQAVSAWMAAGPARALPIAERARELARSAPAALRETTDAIWGHLAVERGDPGAIAATAPIGQRLGPGAPVRFDAAGAPQPAPAELVTPRASVYPYAHCAQYAERFDDALAALEHIRTRVEGAGAADALATVHIFIGNQLLRRGRLAAALEAGERAERFTELTPLAAPFAAMTRAQALAWLGRDEARDAAIAQARALAAGHWMVELWCAHIAALRRLWAGEPAAASAPLATVERILERAGIAEPGFSLWAEQAIAAHLAADRQRDAVRVLGALEARAAGHPARWPRFAAALGRARLADRAGDAEAAIEGAGAALALLDGVDLPLERAQGLLLHGALLRRHGRARSARAPLARAVRLADAAGARPLAALIGEELRLAGGRRRRTSEPDRLTPAELRVARRAAAGASNAEIARALHVTVNTVETHLKRVYAKLGVPGRRRLAAVDLDAHAVADGGAAPLRRAPASPCDAGA